MEDTLIIIHIFPITDMRTEEKKNITVHIEYCTVDKFYVKKHE